MKSYKLLPHAQKKEKVIASGATLITFLSNEVFVIASSDYLPNNTFWHKLNFLQIWTLVILKVPQNGIEVFVALNSNF